MWYLAQRALAPAKAAQRGLHAAVAASRATAAGPRTLDAPLPHPRQIEASLRAEDASKSGDIAQSAKPPPLVFQLAVSDAAVVVPLHSTCALHALAFPPLQTAAACPLVCFAGAPCRGPAQLQCCKLGVCTCCRQPLS